MLTFHADCVQVQPSGNMPVSVSFQLSSWYWELSTPWYDMQHFQFIHIQSTYIILYHTSKYIKIFIYHSNIAGLKQHTTYLLSRLYCPKSTKSVVFNTSLKWVPHGFTKSWMLIWSGIWWYVFHPKIVHSLSCIMSVSSV